MKFTISNKYIQATIITAFLFVPILIFMVSLTVHKASTIEKVKCPMFLKEDHPRAAAQKLYDSDPNLYNSLDGWDNDGKVCENLPKDRPKSKE